MRSSSLKGMRLLAQSARLRGLVTRELVGAFGALGVALVLFTRWSTEAGMTRDEAIYVYAGQQLIHGIPPYSSIFDPKTPGASLLTGLAAAAARLGHWDDLHSMRLLFFAFACLTVVAVYLLASMLWRSQLAGIAAAVVFASFKGFAVDAMTGPDAKTPGILMAVLCLALLVRGKWFSAGLAGSLAFLVWQPLGIYAAVAVAGAAFIPATGERRRAVLRAAAGAVIPVLLVAGYFVLVGALGNFLQATVVFPTSGIARPPESLGDRLRVIADIVSVYYEVYFWVGLILLAAVVAWHLAVGRTEPRTALRHPLVWAVLPTWLALTLFSASDFQGPPDLYPLLPYAALGFGGTAAVLADRFSRPKVNRSIVAAVLACALALTVVSAITFGTQGAKAIGLTRQLETACTIDRTVGPHGTLMSLGDPRPLAMTHRHSPSRFIYLGSGIAKWHVSQLPGHLRGWERDIRAANPTVIVVKGWQSTLHPPLRYQMETWLASVYQPARIGSTQLYLAPGAAGLAASRGVLVRRFAGDQPLHLAAGPQMDRC
ncbi:MAG: hypothetical protein QOJ60_2892 [Actinomycetota bacterium]|nr:hypothetical protein [Actinomycetota bacterium]